MKENKIEDVGKLFKEIKSTKKHNNKVKDYFDFKIEKEKKILLMENNEQLITDNFKQNSSVVFNAAKTVSQTKNLFAKNFSNEKKNEKSKDSGALLPSISQYKQNSIEINSKGKFKKFSRIF